MIIRKTCLLILLLSATISVVEAQWLWDMKKMNEVKNDIQTLRYAPAYRTLIMEADQEMSRSGYSVTYKTKKAPSGHIHDYVSLSRYWWPNPTAADSLPYVYKDGQSNPELAQYDRNSLGRMCAAVNTLSLAFYYSGEEKYAKKAVELLRIWFIEEATKMNPHLEYAQFIPGRDNSKGRPEGLIDSYSFVAMINSLALLQSSKSYSEHDEILLKRWFGDFSTWLENSEQGKKENRAKNNHATAYDSQLITYLLFSGNEKKARFIIEQFPKKRIFAQIEPDGTQPNELWRTLSYHYSWYNLSHMLDVCATAQKLGINLLDEVSSDGRSIYGAMDYLVSFLGKDVGSWPSKQISGWEDKQQDVSRELIRILSIDSTRRDYIPLVQKYAKSDITDRRRLLYGGDDPIAGFFKFADKQFDYAMERVESTRSTSDNSKLIVPRSVDKNGKMVLIASRDWCSGFFPGSLWMMYRYTNAEKWRVAASKYTALLAGEKDDRSSHDVGFKINCSYGNGLLLTHDSTYKNIMVEAAHTLAKRFNGRVGAIRSWDFNKQNWQYPVIIDNMMNLELLFEAAILSGDKTLYDVADAHARTTLAHHFRPDYSSFHVVDYDTISTAPRKKNTHQGYRDESAWARGQAWALYGYTMSFRYTRHAAYLTQAEGVAKFIFQNENMPQDLIPYWDFNDPEIPKAPRDVSAACITAAALYELATYSHDKEKYIALADRIILSLLRGYRASEKADEGFLLLHSTGHYPHQSEIDVPINYADYYFLEALIRRGALDGQ